MKFRDIQATIEIDLSKNLEELWNYLNKKARWGVKKARKEKLTVEFPKDEEDGKKFYELYFKTITSNKLIPKKRNELEKEMSKLFLCKKDGKIIGGAAIKIRRNRTILFLNSSNPEFLKFQPNNLLYWKIIEWSKENKFHIFDLGGFQLNAKKGSKLYEVNKFKKRWGGKLKTYYVQSWNPFYIIGRKVIRDYPSIKKVREEIKFRIWKRGQKNKK